MERFFTKKTKNSPRKSTSTSKRSREEEGQSSRDLEAELKAFSKNPRVGRSPPGQQTAENQLNKEEEEEDIEMEEVKAMFEKITLTIKQMENSIKQEIQELKIQFENKEKSWKEEKAKLNARIDKLEDRLEKEERMKRRNNIFITGEEAQGITSANVKEYIKKNLGEDVEIKEAYPITKDKKQIGLIAHLDNWMEKSRIMKKKSALKGKKVYINDDLSPKEREIQKKIMDKATVERDNKKQVKIGYQKIQIDGIWYRWAKDEETLAEDFRPVPDKNQN